MSDKPSIFVDPDEKEIASLSARKEFLDPNKDYCVITEKRLYHKGKRFNVNGAIAIGKCETIIDLKSISATYFSVKRFFGFLLVGILMLLGAVTMLAVDTDMATMPLMMAGFGVLFIILFFAIRKKIFAVIYSGGDLVMLANNCAVNTLRGFSMAVHAASEARKAAPQAKEEVTPAE